MLANFLFNIELILALFYGSCIRRECLMILFAYHSVDRVSPESKVG